MQNRSHFVQSLASAEHPLLHPLRLTHYMYVSETDLTGRECSAVEQFAGHQHCFDNGAAARVDDVQVVTIRVT